MAIWWEALSVFQQVMICLAVPSVLLFVLQIILVLCGIGNEMEIDTPDSPDFDPADVDTPTVSEVGSFRLITLRGILGFLAVGGWTAYGLNYVLPAWAAGLIGIVAGAIMAVVLALIFYFSKKLESDGTLDISGAVGKVGTVQVYISGHGCTQEFQNYGTFMLGFGKVLAVHGSSPPVIVAAVLTVNSIPGMGQVHLLPRR